MTKKELNRLATRIRTHRKRLGVSLRDAAGQVKVSAATLCRLEGERLEEPTFGTMVRLSRWLNVPVSRLAPELGQ